MIEWKLKRIRFTKGGKGLYKDYDNHNIYLSPQEMSSIGNPEYVIVQVRPKEGKNGASD